MSIFSTSPRLPKELSTQCNPPFYAAPPLTGRPPPFVSRQPKTYDLSLSTLPDIDRSKLFQTIRAQQNGRDRLSSPRNTASNTAAYSFWNDTFAAAAARPDGHSPRSLKGTFSTAERQTVMAPPSCDPAGPARFNMADADLAKLVAERGTLSSAFKARHKEAAARGDVFIHPSARGTTAPHCYEAPPSWPVGTSHHRNVTRKTSPPWRRSGVRKQDVPTTPQRSNDTESARGTSPPKTSR